VLNAFQIARRPVHEREFADFCRRTGRSWNPFMTPSGSPAVAMLFDDAAAYAASMGARLPTRMEWERAARGPSRWLFPWGPDWTPAADRIMSGWGDAGMIAGPDGCVDFEMRSGEWCTGEFAPDATAWSKFTKTPIHEFATGPGVIMGSGAGPLIPNAVVPDRSRRPPREFNCHSGARLARDATDLEPNRPSRRTLLADLARWARRHTTRGSRGHLFSPTRDSSLL
jgi:hypothetical protein